jgi:uncharacterized protein YggU (UPF0235/DUF167 family)
VSFPVRVVARAAKDALAGERAGALLVRLTAPPVAGAANAALARLLGDVLGVRASAVAIVRGAAARDKLVRVAGISVAAARVRLGLG